MSGPAYQGKSIAGERETEKKKPLTFFCQWGCNGTKGLYVSHFHARSQTVEEENSGDPEHLFQGGQAVQDLVETVLTQGMHSRILLQGIFLDLTRIRGRQNHTFQLIT